MLPKYLISSNIGSAWQHGTYAPPLFENRLLRAGLPHRHHAGSASMNYSRRY